MISYGGVVQAIRLLSMSPDFYKGEDTKGKKISISMTTTRGIIIQRSFYSKNKSMVV